MKDRLTFVVPEEKQEQIQNVVRAILGDDYLLDDMLVSEYESAIEERDRLAEELRQCNRDKDIITDDRSKRMNYTNRLENALFSALEVIGRLSYPYDLNTLLKENDGIFTKEFICEFYNNYLAEQEQGNWLLDVYEQNQSDELLKRIADLVREDIKDKLPSNYEKNLDKTINDILSEYPERR